MNQAMEPTDNVKEETTEIQDTLTNQSGNATQPQRLETFRITPLNLSVVAAKSSQESKKPNSARTHRPSTKQTTPTSSRRTPLNDEPILVRRNPIEGTNEQSESIVEGLDEETALLETTLPEIEAYLREKIQSNGANVETREIREYVMLRLSSTQIRQHIPPLMDRLQEELGATGLDIQSSFCMLEDIFVDRGRDSPLVGMYTDEEEDMLKNLELRTVL